MHSKVASPGPHRFLLRFYFGDNITPVLVSGVPLLVQKLKTTHKDENVAIVFPDEGSWKRFGEPLSFPDM